MIASVNTAIAGVRVMYPETVYRDDRGTYVETWNARAYRELLPAGVEFVQDDTSVSRGGVLRGIHGDERTWKLVSCLVGTMQLVVVDWRPASPTKGAWLSWTLYGSFDRQVLIPPGCGNGHLVLSDIAAFHYKQTTYYEGAERQFTLRWDDPALGIRWVRNPTTLSRRDAEAPFVPA